MYGIAGFVDGFTGGVDTAHRWKDRKRGQAREDRMEKRQDRLDAMDAEMHERRLRLLDQQIAAGDKAVEDAAFYDGVYKDAVDATNGAMARGLPGGPVDVTDTVVTSPGATSGLPPPPGILPLGIPQGPNSRPQVAPPGMPSPEELQRLYGASSSSNPGVVNAPVVSAPGPAGGPVPAGPAATARPVPTAADPMAAAGLIRQPDGSYIAPAPRGIIADELAAAGQWPGVRYLPDPEAEARKKAEAEAADASRAGAVELERLRRVRDEDGPIPLAWRREADDKIGAMTRAQTAANPNPALDTAPAPPGSKVRKPVEPGQGSAALSAAFQEAVKPGPGATAAAPPRGKAPASASPMERGLADTAVAAMAATTTPAMTAASVAATRGLPDQSTKKTPTDADRKKYAGDFMDHYREVGAPMVYEALVKRGEFKKAEEFRAFLDRDATKAGMDNWARAAFAASVGDMDTFADEILTAYDRLDYFPDGTTVVRDESGFTRDKSGNITGAKITFRDEKTGNTWDQVFSDPNDMVRLGITLLAPEQAFEFYYEQQQAEAEAARGLSTEQGKRDAETQKRIDDIAKIIFEKSSDPLNPRVDASGNPLPPMTYGEALRQAEAEVLGAGEAAVAPPVARRPQG